jgi:predicted nucleic acid-binding protein
MILVDTSVIVAWLDPDHPDHQPCVRALENCGAVEELAVNSVSRNKNYRWQVLNGQLPMSQIDNVFPSP